MGALTTIRKWIGLPERAATVEQLGHPAAGVIGWVGMPDNTSGVHVTEETALNFAAVFAAQRILAETVASLPCILYRRTSSGGKERVTDDPRAFLMHEEANEQMCAYTFVETLTGHVVLGGNGYAKVIRDGANEPLALEPRLPATVTVEVEDNTLTYNITDPKETIEGPDMLHVRGLGADGLIGYSVVRKAAQSIGSGMAADQYSGAFFGNGATPNGALVFPQRLDKEARDNFRRMWNEMHQGASRSNNIAVLHGGMDYKALGMTNEDAQFLETRKFSVSEIARWFRLPPHMLADLERSTFSNIEHQSLEFVKYSIVPWLKRWEAALNKTLLRREERPELFFEFLVEGLLRGDLKSRYDAYSVGRQWGWLNVNDIKRMENQNTIGPQGDIYLQPMNMVEAGQPPEPAPAPPPADDDDVEDEDEGNDAALEKMKAAAREMIAHELRVSLKIEASAAIKAAMCQEERGENFLQRLDTFYDAHYGRLDQMLSHPIAVCSHLFDGQDGIVSGIVDEHIKRSKQLLLACADGDVEGLADRVKKCVEEWGDPIEFEV